MVEEKLDEEVAIDIGMDQASLIEMFDTGVSEILAFHDFSIVSWYSAAEGHQSFISDWP